MVIVPVTPKGLDALVPQPPKHNVAPDLQRTIVVQVLQSNGGAPQYKINETPYDKRELLPKLTEIYANRAERVMFVKGDDNVDFRYVAESLISAVPRTWITSVDDAEDHGRAVG